MKKVYFLVMSILSVVTFAQLVENGFDYTDGSALQTQTGWTALNTGDDILVSSGSLAYTGIETPTGNKISFAGVGIDSYTTFADQTSGTVYYSFLLNVTTLAGVTDTNGGYFAGFAKDNTTFGGTIWTKRIDDSTYNLGIEVKTANAANTTWDTTTYNAGTTYFVVVAYTFNTGATNDDVVKLWVNPALCATEPTPTISDSHIGTDLTNFGRIFIRQDSATETPSIEMDELRVGLSWADVTPCVAGISEIPLLDKVKVYPTLINDNMNVVLDGKFSVEVLNLNGQQLLNETGENRLQLSTASLSKGIYMVRISQNGETTTQKVVKK